MNEKETMTVSIEQTPVTDTSAVVRRLTAYSDRLCKPAEKKMPHEGQKF